MKCAPKSTFSFTLSSRQIRAFYHYYLFSFLTVSFHAFFGPDYFSVLMIPHKLMLLYGQLAFVIFIFCTSLYMGCIHKYFCRNNWFVFIAFWQNTGKDFFKQVRSFEAPCINILIYRKIRDCIYHFKSKKLTISYIYFDFTHKIMFVLPNTNQTWFYYPITAAEYNIYFS